MLDEPLDDPAQRRLLQACLASGRVEFTQHAREEMAKDDLSEPDVLRVLRRGVADGCDLLGGSWRYRRRVPGIIVVVAFPSETLVRVVTAWRDRK